MRLWLALLLTLILAASAEAACTNNGGGSWTAASASLADVQACLTAASAGNTVNVPAGASTWAGQLAFGNKPLSLVGAGVGSTVVTSNYAADYLITYIPTATNSTLFRVSGFTFDAANNQVIGLANNNVLPAITQVRIDHNRFTNSTHAASGVENFGMRGVVDHNTFDNVRSPVRNWGSSNNGQWDWSNFAELTWALENDTMYYEDNDITVTAAVYMITDGDQGCRYVFRYNNLTATSATYPWFDQHGGNAVPPIPDTNNLYGCFGMEIYGNKYSHDGFMMSQRGGRATVHHNTMLTGTDTWLNLYVAEGCAATAGQKINSSYHFQNRRATSGAIIGWQSSGGDNCGPNTVVVENSTFWVDRAGFDGTVGIGAGTLAGRPGTCTTGVGYWATTQSTTDLTGMVGTNPSAVISGTLYKCTAANTWTEYYTPMCYPHPLVYGADCASRGGSTPSATDSERLGVTDAAAATAAVIAGDTWRAGVSEAASFVVTAPTPVIITISPGTVRAPTIGLLELTVLAVSLAAARRRRRAAVAKVVGERLTAV